MPRLSVLGQRVDPMEEAVVDPRCPSQRCAGHMRPGDSRTTVIVPGTGQLLESLRCDVCRATGWYERHEAWARMPEELEF